MLSEQRARASQKARFEKSERMALLIKTKVQAKVLWVLVELEGSENVCRMLTTGLAKLSVCALLAGWLVLTDAERGKRGTNKGGKGSLYKRKSTS